jgi:hypothetical protein
MAAQHESSHVLRIEGEQVRVGQWSGRFQWLVDTDAQVRQLLGQQRHAEARAVVQAQSAEAQAALVCIDERPEEVLSLTGADVQGRPAYSPQVLACLPADLIAALLAPDDARHEPLNLEVLRRLPAPALARAMRQTLEPVTYQQHRTRLSWEWLAAVAALDDPNRAAELLAQVDESLLVEAFLDRVDRLRMDELVAAGSGAVPAFRLLSAEGEGPFLPPVEDPATDEVLQRLHQAAPELVARALREAWERAGEDVG